MHEQQISTQQIQTIAWRSLQIMQELEESTINEMPKMAKYLCVRRICVFFFFIFMFF